MARILSECLLIEIGKQTEGHQKTVGGVMSKLGFERLRKSSGDRSYYYKRRSIPRKR